MEIKTEKEMYELVIKKKGIFNANSSFNKFWIRNVLSEWPRFNGVYWRNNLPKTIKDEACVINLDEYTDVSAYGIALFCNKSEIVYFDRFVIEHVPEEIKKSIGNKNIKANIFQVQANNSVMCGYFCIGFIDFMLTGKNWLILRACFLFMSLKKLTI